MPCGPNRKSSDDGVELLVVDVHVASQIVGPNTFGIANVVRNEAYYTSLSNMCKIKLSQLVLGEPEVESLSI
jgi:hypothetical protein